ncbi:MAG: hypothetical protein NVS3B26_02960 [Mycobacteriales bacterium]
MTRAVVYNSFWSTAGGAETYGGAVAELLSRHGAVELLGHEPVDVDGLGERLTLDLSGCTTKTVPYASAAVTEASRSADLFVNVSHRSRDVCAAARGLYVVHFPTMLATGTSDDVKWGTGWHVPGGGVTWSDGRGSLIVTAPMDLTIRLGFARPGATELRILIDGREALTTTVGGQRAKLHRWGGEPVRVHVQGSGPVEVTLVCEPFQPTADRRLLGVPVRSVTAARSRTEPSTSMGWLDSYDVVVANSAFTAQWVRRIWGRDSAVLHPPVSLRAGGRKDRSILSVGRFIPTGRGHAKKQLELVRSLRRLVDAGLTGWTLHLVGGLAEPGREYFAQLEREAAGYPVVLHPDASGAELGRLYAGAALYWHAAGLDEQDPERLEHFGISTVEAMSAGAVPVVIGRGGLVETVRDGIDGYLCADLDELVRRTSELSADEPLRTRMAASAQRRAQDFSLPAFDERLQQLLA